LARCLYLVSLLIARQLPRDDARMEKQAMKYSQNLVAAAVAVGALTLVAIDAHAKVVCGQNGCQRVYPHRSQWPVGQPGKYYNTAPWGCAMIGGQRVCHQR